MPVAVIAIAFKLALFTQMMVLDVRIFHFCNGSGYGDCLVAAANTFLDDKVTIHANIEVVPIVLRFKEIVVQLPYISEENLHILWQAIIT